jgi:indole-3-glycerol phosphate synthase
MNRLKEIIKAKKQHLKAVKKALPFKELLKKKPFYPIRDFKSAIKKQELTLIAEIKKASPSAGILRRDFNPIEIAKIYQAAGVSAISVLTEKDYFGGDLSYINTIKRHINLPILRKDFIFDEYQVYESYAAGADAILLLVSILSGRRLRRLYNLAKELGLASLIEVSSRYELRKALRVGAEIIGINNRNLKNFKVDLRMTDKLIKYIPKDKIIVSESGIKTRNDILHLKELGVNCVLIGETFMRASDITGKIKELMI